MILSGFHLAQRVVTRYFSSQELGAQGMRGAEAELHSWCTGKSSPHVKRVVFVLSVGREVSAS